MDFLYGKYFLAIYVWDTLRRKEQNKLYTWHWTITLYFKRHFLNKRPELHNFAIQSIIHDDWKINITQIQFSFNKRSWRNVQYFSEAAAILKMTAIFFFEWLNCDIYSTMFEHIPSLRIASLTERFFHILTTRYRYRSFENKINKYEKYSRSFSTRVCSSNGDTILTYIKSVKWLTKMVYGNGFCGFMGIWKKIKPFFLSDYLSRTIYF